MSKMNELDLCIQEVSEEDQNIRDSVTAEISDHLNGLKPFYELSFRAQRAIEIWETTNEEESYRMGQLCSYPCDEEITLEEE